MKTHILFPTYLWEFDDPQFNPVPLLDEIRQSRPALPQEFNLFETRLPEIERLEKFIEQCVREAVRDVCSHTFSHISRGWLNVNPHAVWESPHTHGGVHMAGVYYIQTPVGGGDLHLSDTRGVHWMTSVNAQSRGGRTTFAYTPAQGKLVLFPASIPHCMSPNLSAHERISIACNIALKPIV